VTPVYGVLAAGFDSEHEENYPAERSSSGVRYQVPLSESEARRVVDQLQAEGVAAKAYHYGWKERGFQTHEVACAELCHNERWEAREARLRAEAKAWIEGLRKRANENQTH